jgi:hypothetical protein
VIRVEFDTDNAAFGNGDLATEAARLLRDAAERIEQGATTGALRDLNGNKVGYFEVLPDQSAMP